MNKEEKLINILEFLIKNSINYNCNYGGILFELNDYSKQLIGKPMAIITDFNYFNHISYTNKKIKLVFSYNIFKFKDVNDFLKSKDKEISKLGVNMLLKKLKDEL